MLKILTNITQERKKKAISNFWKVPITGTAALVLGQVLPADSKYLRYFRDEYEAHIKEKRCPALSQELIAFIDPDTCRACMTCLKNVLQKRLWEAKPDSCN